jgi:DNA-binding transcriptional LysR family regulator
LNISIKQLRAFLALREHCNFTRAASGVCLSQPAFSALINGLETEVGFRLFDRDTHRVHLTPDGEAFDKIAIHLIGLYDASTKEIEALARGERGRVCIAALPSVAVSWLPAVLPPFRERYPKVRVELIDALSDRCLQALSDGVADFAVTTFRDDHEDLQSEKLCSEAFYFVCHKSHPLAGKRTTRLEDLHGKVLLNFAGSTSIRQYVDDATPRQILKDSLEVEQMTTMMGLVSAALGACVIPELALYQFRRPDIVIIPLEDFPVRREIHLIRRSDRALSTAAQNLCDALIAYAKSSRSGDQDGAG